MKASVAFLIVLTSLIFFSAADAQASSWTDSAGDVTLSNADIISGSATVNGNMVDLRVQLLAPPFPTTATHFITWCLDTDQNKATGSACGFGDFLGADHAITLWGGLGALSTCDFNLSGTFPGLDASSHLWFDQNTNTVRLLFPLSLLPDDGLFNYTVESVFGGSFGNNDRAPDSVNFGVPGGFFTSDVDVLPPFGGTLWCCVGSITIDVKPGSIVNSVNPRSRGVIPVAILNNETFDVTTIDLSTVRFGATGTETAPVHSAFEDVDGDGDTDIILQFDTQETGIQCGNNTVSLAAKTISGQMIQDSDSIKTAGCN